MLVSLDIETEKLDLEKPWSLHNSRISCVGLYSKEFSTVFRDKESLQRFILENNFTFVGQNFKFDIKHLKYHWEVDLVDRWEHDTQLMAATSFTKIDDTWLENYEIRRQIENKNLPQGVSHRPARYHSLKTLAPYFLNVEPFWENPADHDNDEYVLKDAEYTYRLYEYFSKQMKEEGTYDFYKNWLLPKAKMLVDVELKGIKIDKNKLARAKDVFGKKRDEVKEKLDVNWSSAYDHYYEMQQFNCRKEHREKRAARVQKSGKPLSLKLSAMYDKNEAKAIAKIEPRLNLNSPTQLTWLLKDYLNYDIKNRVYDPKEKAYVDKESTGVETLRRLSRDHSDIQLLLDYREYNKLVTSFIDSYLKLMDKDGILRTNYNIAGTRTGRLSSSEPNLQQVPAELKDMFVAREGYSLITRDESGIEARLIAYYSQDKQMCELLMADQDFHSNSAKAMFDYLKDISDEDIKKLKDFERSLAKTCGFALIYGARANRIRSTALKEGKVWSKSHCNTLLENFGKAYKDAFHYKEDLDIAAADRPIKNFFGRKHSYINKLEDIYMKAFNTLIQSSASDMVLEAAYMIQEEFKKSGIDGQLLLLVHDELVFEVRDSQVKIAEEIIERLMTAFTLRTKYGNLPLKVEGCTGGYWSK